MAKLVRILIYEGERDVLERHLGQAFLHPDAPKDLPWSVDRNARERYTMREIFRGWQEARVEHADFGTLEPTKEVT